MLNCGGCNVVDRSTLIVVLCLLHPFQQYTRQQCMLLASQMHATSLIRQHTRSPALFLDTSCTGCGTPGSGPANCKAPTPSSSVLAAGWMEKVIHSGISISAWMMAAPQMGRCTPLMKLAASEARNRMGPRDLHRRGHLHARAHLAISTALLRMRECRRAFCRDIFAMRNTCMGWAGMEAY